MIEKELTLAEFPAVTYEQWRASLESELKGVPFEKKLVTQTLEEIDIQPLYTAENSPGKVDSSGFPGFLPLTRGRRFMGNTAGWDIRQEHLHPTPAEANRTILEDLKHGVTSIELKLDSSARVGFDADSPGAADLSGQDGVMVHSTGDLDEVLRNVHLDMAPVSLNSGSAFLPAAALLVSVLRQRKTDPAQVRFAFNADPLGALMSEGQLGVPLADALNEMADLAAWTAIHYPQATAVKVDSGVYHHAGATSTQDLAFTIATAVEYLRVMTGAGMNIDTAARQIVFDISVGCQFFRAIAKVRALRKMWAKVVISCGGSEEAARSTQIHVRTSKRILTRRDPWVNLLRNTVCCFAGAVGGADLITTAPLDAAIGLSDEFSRHLARNTQIILQEESHLNREIDPAGGSWFLESLTDQVAEKAWTLFQGIEERGGIIQASKDGWISNLIGEVESKREKNLATRKQAVTGISEHPNVSEEPVVRKKPDTKQLRIEASTRLAAWRSGHSAKAALSSLGKTAVRPSRPLGALTEAAVLAAQDGATLGQLSSTLVGADGTQAAKVEPLVIHPYAAAYEELRDASDKFAATTGKRPAVFLANMGTASDFIGRATYAMNFFQAGGFETTTNDGFADPVAAAKGFTKSGAKIAVICSSDKKYETVAEETAAQLKSAGARTVILAGSPGVKEERYREAGIERFIFMKCDVLGTLHNLLVEEGVL